MNVLPSKTQTLQNIFFLYFLYQGVFGTEVFVMYMFI